jgi:serine protease AprX
MNRMLKIFVGRDRQAALDQHVGVIERYDGFLLAEAPPAKVRELSREYLVQDITGLYEIPLARGTIDTSTPRIDADGVTRSHPDYPRGASLTKGPHHYLVQFIGPIKERWIRGVRRAGGEPRELHSNFAYVVRARQAALKKIVALPYVRWTGHLPRTERLTSSVIAGMEGEAPPPRKRVLPLVYVVEFYTSDDANRAVPAVKRLGLIVLAKKPRGKILVVRTAHQKSARTRQLKALSTIHGVRKIRERAKNRLSNDVATGILGTAVAMGHPGLGLSGRGEIVAVCDGGLDTGNPDAIHPDFRGRVASIQSYEIPEDYEPDRITNHLADDGPADLDSGHGTHVAGSVLGDGSASTRQPPLRRRIRGCAYRAKLVFQAVEQEVDWKRRSDLIKEGRYTLAGIPTDPYPLFGDAYRKGARIHSNSWNGGLPRDYDQQCRRLDEFVWEHPDFCVLFAAGNDGSDRERKGEIARGSVAPPATAKNCITVGACENRRPAFNSERWGGMYPKDFPVPPFKDDPVANRPNEVAAFSSRGPTATGRYKPDVVAPGTFVLSTRSAMIAWDNVGWATFRPKRASYFYLGGTSMATPLVAGAVALLREYLRRNGNPSPSAALLKAALIAGAKRLPGYGERGAVVDNAQGYGRVDLDAVLAPALPASTRFLDLDPGLGTGEVHTEQLQVRSGRRPLRIALAYSDPPGIALMHDLNLIVTDPDGRQYIGNQPPGSRTPDTENNVEVVHVGKPRAGSWRVDVVASNAPLGRQGFGLVTIGHF